MHRPVAGQFQGSMPAEASVGFSLASQLDVGFAVLAILGAIAVWVGAYVLVDEPDLPSVLKGSCLMLLLPSLVGLRLVAQAERAPRRVLAGIYDAVFRRLELGERPAVGDAPQEGFRGLAGLVGELALATRRLQLRRARDRQGMAEANLALACGRAQAGQLADQIRIDAASLAGTAVQMEAAERRLSSEIADATTSFELTDGAVCRALEGVTTLAGAVRATTAGAERMATLAVRLSQVAHDTQRTVADLDDQTARLSVALDRVTSVIHQAGSDASSGGGEPTSGQPGHPATGAAELHAMSDNILATLQDGMQTLRDLTAVTSEAVRRTAEISELIRSNHEVGLAIGHAVQQQGQDIGLILRELYEARSGFVTLRAGVEAVTRAGTARTDAALSVRETAQRLPNRAETVASILRNLPDFAPREP